MIIVRLPEMLSVLLIVGLSALSSLLVISPVQSCQRVANCNDQGLLMLLANTYLVNLAKIHTGYTYKKDSYFMTDKD